MTSQWKHNKIKILGFWSLMSLKLPFLFSSYERARTLILCLALREQATFHSSSPTHLHLKSDICLWGFSVQVADTYFTAYFFSYPFNISSIAMWVTTQILNIVLTSVFPGWIQEAHIFISYTAEKDTQRRSNPCYYLDINVTVDIGWAEH